MGNTIIIILISLFFSFFFAGMEIAYLSANKLKLELDKKKGGFTSHVIAVLAGNKEQYIATMLVGNNIALVIYGIEIAVLLTPALGKLIQIPSLLLLVQTLISTIIVLVTAEFLPKSIFRLHPNAFLRFFALPVYILYIIFYPISKFTSWLSYWIIRLVFRIKVKHDGSKPIFNKVDLDFLVDQASSADDGEGDHTQELKIFQNALDFSEVRLRDCMIPRTDIEAIDVNATVDELRAKFAETNYSRLPVYSNSIDNIVGYVNSKVLFINPQSIKSKLINIDFVPETMPANKMLTRFIKEHKSIAIVVDEFGGTAGLVTIEDIMEEIFGEIDDEHDRNEFVEKKLSDNEYIFSGRLEVKHLNENYQLDIPESDDYETLAGFILFKHQNIPKLNETIEFEGFIIKILRVNETRIELVRLTRIKGKG